MSDKSFIRPIRIPGKRFVVTKNKLLEAQKHTKSNMAAAKWLGVSYNTYKRWAKYYNVFEQHLNQSGVGVRKGWATFRIPIDEILNGTRKCNYTLPTFKKRLIEEGCMKEECYECGWNEGRVTDGKIPLTIDFIDGKSDNKSLDNMRLLCPNCYFIFNGFFHNSRSFVK